MPKARNAASKLATILLCTALFTAPVHAADERVAAALAARERGDYVAAIGLLRAAVADAPADADDLRLLGTTLAFAHRYREAIAVLSRARALSPRDMDIALALSRAMLWSGDVGGARRVAREAATIEPANAELRELSATLTAAERERPRIALDVAETTSRVAIGTGHRTWYETAATLAVPVGASSAIAAGIDAEDRSTATDTRLSLRADRRFAWGTAYLGGTVTPSASFRERWSVLTGAVVPLTPYLLGSVEVRRAHYDLVDVTVVEPGVSLHSPADRWAVTARSLNLWGEGGRFHPGWSLRGDWSATHALRLFGGGATYSDTEAGITRRVESGFIGVGFPISGRLGAQIIADHEVRRASYRRDGVTLGLRWRFGP